MGSSKNGTITFFRFVIFLSLPEKNLQKLKIENTLSIFGILNIEQNSDQKFIPIDNGVIKVERTLEFLVGPQNEDIDYVHF